MREAAVVPLAFITAWEGLVDRMAVHAGQSVRVLGGAGGVGRVAIQIARAREADVSATGYPADQAAIERLGVYLGTGHESAPCVRFVRTDPELTQPAMTAVSAAA